MWDQNTDKISTNEKNKQTRPERWKDYNFPGIRFAWGGGILGCLYICIWLAF